MENLTEDAKQIMGLHDVNGILISEILPNSTAAAAGFKRGDILSSLNNVSIRTIDDVFSWVATQSGGQTFSYELYRDKKRMKGTSSLTSFPQEKYPDLDVIYTEAQTALGPQRIIITKPRIQKKLPVVAFIGGMGCYSLDFPMDSNRSEVQLLNGLSRSGYLCARLEKPGMGDNAKYTKACNAVSLMEETDGYVQAIRSLKNRDDVDSTAVFIFGHSMGGVFAPMIANSVSLKGIIAYGLIGSNLIESLAKTRRTIAAAYAMPPGEADALVRDFSECVVYYFAEKLTTAEAAKKKPVCAEYLSIFDLRARAYNDELYAQNIPALWETFKGKAAILWGESDFIASGDDHRIIADAINFYHPGHAEYIPVRQSDHGMHYAAGFSEARQNPGPYNQEVGKAVINWLEKQRQ